MSRFALFLVIFIFSAVIATAEDLSLSVQKNSQLESSQILLSEELSPNEEPFFKPYQPAKNEVVFSHTKSYINSINPTAKSNKTGGYLPGARGVNQLVIYTPDYGTNTNTNEYGAEAIVVGNTVTELSGADSLIPYDGLVISGHGTAKNWMNSSIKVGTKIHIDKSTNVLYTYTTSESYIFESEKKIDEAEQMLEYYKTFSHNYNWKIPYGYIKDAKGYLKKARKNHDEVQKYSQLAIEASNDAIKSVLPYKNNELKGVWIRPVEKSEKDIISTLEKLQKAGIDNIFLETYFHGKTIFPSKTMEAYGLTIQNEQFKNFDPLDIWVKEAHKRGIKIHTWFETFYVGVQNPNDNPTSILAKNPSWGNKIKKDKDLTEPSKSASEHNGYFLDPANPYVQDFLIKIAEEIISTYKPDGINVDYIRYPNCVGTNELTNWGYTDFARNDFKMIYGVDPIDLKRTDDMWKNWDTYRQEQVTNMIKKFGQLGRRTNTYISAVVFPDRQAALKTKHQDWKTWSTRGYLNALTPLFLTCDSKTANKMMKDVIDTKSEKTDFYAGLFVTFMGGSDEDLIRQIHEARKLSADGVIIFDYAHLNNKYINTLSRSVFATPTPLDESQENNDKRKGWWIFKKD